MKYLAIGLGVVALAAVGAVGAALGTEHRPAPIEPTEVICGADTQELTKNEPFQMVSWNLQYGASRKHQFFYDGGEAVHVPEEDVRWTLDAVNQVLTEINPELMLLQEVDRGSKRTSDIDQHLDYVNATGATCHTSAPYHKSPFVPVPSGNALGKVDMELSLLTQTKMTRGERIQLAMLDEPRARQMFNLKRALLWGEVPVHGMDLPLAIAVTHLSAFSFGDGTLERQIGQLKDWMDARPEGQPWILAGDLNLLPPGDDKMRLENERDLYADSNNPVDVLFEAGFHEIFQDPLAPENRTYLSYGTSEPDRKIDYVFIGGPIHLLEAQVIRGEALEISDHLPIRAKFVVGDAPAAPEPEPVMEPAPEPLLDGVQDPGMDPAPEMDADTETQNE